MAIAVEMLAKARELQPRAQRGQDRRFAAVAEAERLAMSALDLTRSAQGSNASGNGGKETGPQ